MFEAKQSELRPPDHKALHSDSTAIPWLGFESFRTSLKLTSTHISCPFFARCRCIRAVPRIMPAFKGELVIPSGILAKSGPLNSTIPPLEEVHPVYWIRVPAQTTLA